MCSSDLRRRSETRAVDHCSDLQIRVRVFFDSHVRESLQLRLGLDLRLDLGLFALASVLITHVDDLIEAAHDRLLTQLVLVRIPGLGMRVAREHDHVMAETGRTVLHLPAVQVLIPISQLEEVFSRDLAIVVIQHDLLLVVIATEPQQTTASRSYPVGPRMSRSSASGVPLELASLITRQRVSLAPTG